MHSADCGSSGVAGIERSVLDALAPSRGHFVYESGHHGDLWLDLEALFVDARRARGWAAALAALVGGAASCRPELVCGPLTGGAFVAQSLAAEIGAGFVFAERLAWEARPPRYRIPEPMRAVLRGRRVLLADDAVNAGSAWTSTLADLVECGGVPAGFATLGALGDAAARIAKQHGAPLFALASLERSLWPPEDCPLCRSRVPLTDHGDPQASFFPPK